MVVVEMVVVVVVCGEGEGGEISSFQVIHEALSKLYPMIYHRDVLAEPESPPPKTGNVAEEG